MAGVGAYCRGNLVLLLPSKDGVNFVGEKALWPAVVAGGVIAAMITVLMLGGVEAVNIIAVFSIATNLIMVMLFGKVQKIEQNTNGNVERLHSLVENLVDYTKKSAPVEPMEERK